MKKTLTKLLGGALLALFLVPSTASATITAKWDWQNNTPAGIRSITTIENATGTVASNIDGVTMFVDATSGKLKPNGDNAQFNSGTILHIPVVSTSDVITFTPHSSSYHGVTIGTDDYDDTSGTERTHTATIAEVQQGYVEITSKGGYIYGVKVELAYMPPTKLVATWNWATDIPSGIQEISYNKNSGSIDSNLSGISLYVNASSGKLAYNNVNSAQFNSGTIIQVPVTSTADVVTVTAFSGYQSNISINNVAMSTATVEYDVTSSDVTTDYVEIKATANAYLVSIVLEKPYFTTATIGTTGWATFSSTQPTNFTKLNSVVNVYQVTGNTGSAINKSSVTTAAASTGLLLNGAAGTYAIPLTTTGTDLSGTNKLVAVTSAQSVDPAGTGYTNYVLAKSGDDAVFKYFTSAVNIDAGKAYLHLDVADPANPAHIFFLDDDATGVNVVRDQMEDASGNFDRQGRKVAQPTKGLYIVNGKKVVMK